MLPTYRQRRRLPKPRDIGLAWRTISALFPMGPAAHGWRESLKGVANYRFQSITNGKAWLVDIYAGGFYVVTIGGVIEPCKSIPSLVGHMSRMLRVRPRGMPG